MTKVRKNATGGSKSIQHVTQRKKRGSHCLWSETMMAAAIEAVQQQNMSQRAACKKFCVPRCTLQVRLSGKTETGAKPGKPTMLSSAQETKIVDYACNRALMGIGFGKRQFLQYAGDFAKKHRVNFKNGRPTKRWWSGMKRRHERLRLRQPEGTAAVRHQCMDAVKVRKYFSTLKSVLDANNLLEKPHSIWNMDETGVQLDHKPGKIIAAKGTKYLHSRTSGNRETITIIGAISAAGDVIPPHIIVKGKTCRSLNSFDTVSAPEGSTWSWSDSGWTKQGIALLWFKESFLPNIGPERPQLLILDGHDSHNFVELIDAAIENNIHILELPAHTSNWLQPCDRTVFGPFKNAYRKACEDLVTEFPGSLVSRSTFCGIMKKAWSEAVTPSNVQSGFRACGIYPFNADAIPTEAYIPNTLYSSDVGQETVEEMHEKECLLQSVEKTNQSTEPSLSITHSTTAVASGESRYESKLDHTNDVLTLSDYVSENPAVVSAIQAAVPPSIALSVMESSMSSQQLDCFQYCYSRGYHLDKDESYLLWKDLKNRTCDITQLLIADTSVSELDLSLSSLPEIATSADLGTDLDLSITDLLYSSATNQAGGSAEKAPDNETSHGNNNILKVNVDADAAPNSVTDANENHNLVVGTTTDGLASSSTPSSNKFPFKNSSYPGDPDSDVLSYPPLIQRNKKRKGNTKQKYYLLTSKEARDAKQQEKQEKLDRETKKAAVREARAQKVKAKLDKKSSLATRKVTTIHTVRKATKKSVRTAQVKSKETAKRSNKGNKADRIPCSTCLVRFCDDQSGTGWVQCQGCDKWYHTACQGLIETEITTFMCISCEDDA